MMFLLFWGETRTDKIRQEENMRQEQARGDESRQEQTRDKSKEEETRADKRGHEDTRADKSRQERWQELNVDKMRQEETAEATLRDPKRFQKVCPIREGRSHLTRGQLTSCINKCTDPL